MSQMPGGSLPPLTSIGATQPQLQPQPKAQPEPLQTLQSLQPLQFLLPLETFQLLQPTVTTQKPLGNTLEKCCNFLAKLLDLSSNESLSIEMNVRNLIQEMIDAQLEPETFCERLECLLNATPQPCLIGFLKKSLPLLRQSLVTKEIVIDGINPPSPHVAFAAPIPSRFSPVMANNVQFSKPRTKTDMGITILQNIPMHTKVNVSKVGKLMTVNSKFGTSRSKRKTALSTFITPRKLLLKDKEKKTSIQRLQRCVDDKMMSDDDINDVAAMGGVNLAEESQQILCSTKMVGAHIRSVKDQYLTPVPIMQLRLKMNSIRIGMEEPSPVVSTLLIHAFEERLKSFIEKLAIIAEHRIDYIIKTDPRYELKQDVTGQLTYLAELDRNDKKQHENSVREILVHAAKSCSKNENPEKAKLKATAKEMLRAKIDEVRQQETNLTALQAIGPRKMARLDELGGSGNIAESRTKATVVTGGSQLALRMQLKRVNLRDMIFLLEQERDTARSTLLCRCYLK